METYILYLLSQFIDKNSCSLYCDGILILSKNVNGQKADKIRKLVIKNIKDVGFKIKIKTNLKIVDVLDVPINLNKGTYSSYKKPNGKILYTNTLSKHPWQTIKQLPTSINERLSKNSSNEEIFNKSKADYKKILETSVSNWQNLEYKKTTEKTQKNRRWNIIWFNPPFNKNANTNVAKRFLSLIDNHFLLKDNKPHKIF